jgi:type IV pilus assembly protein PilY1
VGSFNSGVLTGNNLTGSVSVLAQTVVNEQTVNDTNLRVLSENDPDWMTSTTDGVSCGEALGVAKCDLNGVGQDADPLRNVGWYLNLPASRERVVSDVLVKDGKLIVVSFMPDASMCGTGGSSWLMTMDACSGGRFQEAQFDTNGDGVIDDQDLINIGTAQDPIMVPPTGIEYAGRLQPPAIIVLENGQEILHMSSSSGEIKSVTEKSADLGITFWKVFRP